MTDRRLFAGVPADHMEAVLAIARRRRFARGEVVFHVDDPADSLHLIVKGRFAVRLSTPLGDEATLAVCGPGEAFGELALLSDAPRSATIVALEPSETRSIYRDDFTRLRREHPALDDVLLRLLADQSRRLSARLVEALYVPAPRRVLRRVHELAMAYDADTDGPIVIPLTQDDIAGLAGTSRVTVNRVLRAESERGTIEIGRGRVIVRDLPGLARRAR
jgi:CRP/FNR family transcriptional regulator, cyclic AMP receptor protein